jgi:hypothetical protein
LSTADFVLDDQAVKQALAFNRFIFLKGLDV